MLVSILINNYNYDEYIKFAIDSALSQTYNNTEIIVVDDGSTDNSREIIKSYGNKIISIFKENGGQASAFNAGFAKSKGEIICFLDADDFFLTNKIKKIVETFQNNSNIGWVFHELSYVDELGTELSITRPSKVYSEKVVDFRTVIVQGKSFSYYIPCSTCGLCFRRNVINKILPMPEAKNVTLSDNYIKFAALALSPGLLSTQKLAVQKIHGDNTYTFCKNIEKLRAEITIKTGFYLRQNFPDIAIFANKIFTQGLGIILTEFIFGNFFDIPEIKIYFKKYFSWRFTISFFLRVMYYFFDSLLSKCKLILSNKFNFKF